MPVLISFDWGWGGTAAVIGQLIDGHMVILDSITASNMTLSTFLNQKIKPLIFERYRGCNFVGVGDPSGGKNWASPVSPFIVVNKFFNETLGDEDYMTYKRVTNDVTARLEAVDEHLSIYDQVILCPEGTIELQDALEGEYHWDVDEEGTHIGPNKGKASHVADAHQYWHLMMKMLIETNPDIEMSSVYYETDRYG